MGRKGRAGRGRLAVLGATVSMVCESTTDEAMLDGGKGRRRGRMAVVMVVNTHTTHLAAAVLQRLAERSVGLDPPPTAAAAQALSHSRRAHAPVGRSRLENGSILAIQN
jgi:hypothetical protein